MPRKPIGEKAMTDAERQARYRGARATDARVTRTRRPADLSIGAQKGPPIGMEKGPLLIIGSGSSPESIGGTCA